MFPIHTISGKVVAFGGRTLKKDDKTAKYLNSPESEIYHKSDELYGIFFAKQAIVKEDRCFLVEGYTDVISMHQAGVQNVVASSGTSLTPGQIRLIHRFTPNITVLYDGDAAGIKASIRGIDLLLEEGMNIKVVLLPDGEDPDSYARTHNASDFIDFIDKNQVDFIKFKINLLLQDAGNDPAKRAVLNGDVVRSIALIPDKLITSEYVKECSSLLSLEEEHIYGEVKKLQAKMREDATKRLKNSTSEASDILSTTLLEYKIENPVDQKINQQELDILYFAIRHGVEFLYREYDTESHEFVRDWSVGEYIVAQLFSDNIEFKNPLNMALLNEFATHLQDEGFQPVNFFMRHTNSDISRLAVDLMTDKYQLSKIFTREEQHTSVDEQYRVTAKAKRDAQKLEEHRRWLLESVPRVIYEYKNSIVVDLIKTEMLKLKEAAEARDIKATESIMNTIATYNTLKAQFAKELGERVIVKMS
jgi:DNA primase